MLGLFSTALLSILCRSATAQVSGCTDVGCPYVPEYSSTNCTLDELSFNDIGVTNLTTKLSSSPLTWTVGRGFITTAVDKPVTVSARAYYLGQPPGVDLHENSSITACALFFTGIADQLKFNYSVSTDDAGTSTGTCDDALGSSCASDWLQQANDIALYSNEANFTCQQIAAELQAYPPAACKMAKKSWGLVTAKEISGPLMQPPSHTDRCNITEYSTYSQTKVFTSNDSLSSPWYPVVPIVTIMRHILPKGQPASEAHLSCLKTVVDANTSDAGMKGNAAHHRTSQAIPTLLAILLTLNWLLWY